MNTYLDLFVAHYVNEVSQQLMTVLLLEAFETWSPETKPIPTHMLQIKTCQYTGKGTACMACEKNTRPTGKKNP